MQARHIAFGGVLVAATALITGQVVSQDHSKDSKPPAMPAMTPEQQAEMAKWVEFATPNDNHALLKKRVGRWNGEVKMWEQPGAEPQTSQCTAEIKSIFDGRYIVEEVEGASFIPGQTFMGRSIAGYDNLKKKFVWVWIDNMGTGLMTAEGAYDAASKTFKYTYSQPDVMKGTYVPGHSVDRWIDDNKIVGEMYASDKAGKEFKMMQITYTRAK